MIQTLTKNRPFFFLTYERTLEEELALNMKQIVLNP